MMQKQIEVGQSQRVESAKLQRAAEEHVASLEAQLSAAETQAKALRSQAKSVTEDANKEARKLQRLEDKVSRGQLLASEAMAQLEQALDDLPEVQDAQRRLLGLRMGGSAELSRATEAGDAQAATQAIGDDEWLPQPGEEVLVCIKHSHLPGSCSIMPCLVYAIAYLHSYNS